MLYLKVAELLSSGLQTAIEQIKAGKLCLSSTVKQGKGLLAHGTKAWDGRMGNVTKAGRMLSERDPPAVSARA